MKAGVLAMLADGGRRGCPGFFRRSVTEPVSYTGVTVDAEKPMAQHEPIRRGGSGPTAPQEIPDKLYFRIGEVAKLCGVQAYVLRFWETEFPQLHPNKGGTGQRLYRRRDVEMALRIKTLLYDEGYTIAGARQAFKQELRAPKAGKSPAEGPTDVEAGAAKGSSTAVDVSHLRVIEKELREIHTLLLKPAPTRTGVQPIRAAKLAPLPLKAEPAPRREPRVMTKPLTMAEAFETLFDHLEEPFDKGRD